MLWGMCSNLVVNAIFVAADLRLIQAGFAPWSIGLVSTAAGVCGILGAIAAPRIIERVADRPAHGRSSPGASCRSWSRWCSGTTRPW